MPFYMNPFDAEFRGNFVLEDRQYILTFRVPPNRNKSDQMMAWNNEPYDFSTYNTLTLNVAIDPTLTQFFSIAINVAGATPSATTAAEVVTALNNNSTFIGYFTASIKTWIDKSRLTQSTVFIQAKRPAQSIRMYIDNAGAEQLLGFNAKAGIAEIPSYFDKHLISNDQDPTSERKLIKLDGTDATVDRPIIRNFLDNQSWTNSDLKTDWQLLEGRSALFTFKKQTVDGSDRVTAIIEYPAGAVAGDFAKKTTFSYTSTNTNPDVIAEVPYVLTSGDLITPP